MKRALAALAVVGALALAGCDYLPATVPPNSANPPSCDDAARAVAQRYGWSYPVSCVPADQAPAPNYAGWTTPTPIVVYAVNTTGDFDYWTQVIAHEQGHAWDFGHWSTVLSRYQTFCTMRGISFQSCFGANGGPSADAMEDFADVIAYANSLWKQLDARTWRTIGGHVPTQYEIDSLRGAGVIP